jgi:putative FmdB family regulatory protein
MPTYEYQCRTCNHRFETWQRMVDEPLTVCPECGGQIRRVLFPAGIVFKGSGFYKTDHGNGSVPSENGHKPKTEEAESTSTKGAETKAESKSESGAEKSGAKPTEDKVTTGTK